MSLAIPAWCRTAITETHRSSWSARIVSPTGTEVELPITAGRLLIDADRYPRTSAEVSVGDLSLVPRLSSDPLLPFGSVLQLVYRLESTAGDVVELRPAPELLVDSIRVDRGSSVGFRITAADRSLAVDTDVYPVPTSLPSTSRTVESAIEYLLKRTRSTSVLDVGPGVAGSTPIGDGYTLDGSPWAAIEDLADTVEAECFVLPSGRFTLQLRPAVTAPVDQLRTGPGGTITDAASTVIRGYNRVLLTYRDAAGRTILGRWADTSSGPLRVSGPYGRVTLAEPRDRVASQAQADAAAARLARAVAGRVRDVELQAVGAPWLLPGDTVGVVLPTGSDDLVLTAVEHDLTGLGSSSYRFRTDTLGPI
jgi:hypothetical protein